MDFGNGPQGEREEGVRSGGGGNQSSEEREESVECDLTAEDCGMFGLPN